MTSIWAGYQDHRPAYIPSANGYYKLGHCTLVGIEHQILEHFSSRGGMRAKDKQIYGDSIITLRTHCMEEIEDPFTTSLTNFSVMELFKELEKRTKITS